MRIGIAGCGIRGTLFARALGTVPGVEVAGICDPSPGARERAASTFAGPVHTDHRKLIDSGLDALVVATPDFAHRDVAVDGAAAGLALMIEKPLATTVEDATVIQQAVNEHGVSCFVAFENRWNPYFRRARAAVAAGELGEVVSVTAVLSNSFFVPTQMLSWAAASSPAWFLMPHTVDLAMWLTGEQPETVTAWGRRGELAARGVDTWDAVHALVSLPGGRVANLQSSWILPDSRPSIVDFRVDVVGTRGSISIDHSDQGYRVAADSGYRWEGSLPADIDGQEQSMAAWMVRSWAKGLVEGRPVGPGVDHGLMVTRTVDAIQRSITTGPVTIDVTGTERSSA